MLKENNWKPKGDIIQRETNKNDKCVMNNLEEVARRWLEEER